MKLSILAYQNLRSFYLLAVCIIETGHLYFTSDGKQGKEILTVFLSYLETPSAEAAAIEYESEAP